MASIVTSTGLAHYHEKMKTLLNGKANTNHTHNYAGAFSSGGGAKQLANFNNNTRPTSANLDLTNTYNNAVSYMMATSEMKTGKPPSDGHILTFGWDSTAGWGSQLALGDGKSNAHLYLRGADAVSNKSVWADSWNTVLDSTNYTNYAATKGHTHDINALINTLGTGTATPQDADYYICQTAGGGSSDLSYARRSTSALWAYIKGKADSIYQSKGSYAAASHTHSSVLDSNNGAATTFAYSKAGINYDDYGWIAVWNGQELRAADKNQFAKAGHTHAVMTNAEIDALF